MNVQSSPAVPHTKHRCDVLVIGSGAGGFAAAITARKAGLDVLLTEKASVFGGTTATSGGYIWIPGNPLAQAEGQKDDPDDQRLYLRNELGDDYDPRLIEAYLANGPAMVNFFVDEVGIPFRTAAQVPDYHPGVPGASLGGRSLFTEPVSARILGRELERLRPLPRELSLFGMGVSSGSDLGHFYKFGKSVKSTVRVVALLARYGFDRLLHGRGQALVNGNALIARLARALLDLGTPIWTMAPATDLILDGNRVVGAMLDVNGKRVEVRAAKGVVLASGGIAHDIERRARAYSHRAGDGEHVSLTAPGNTGDGARMAESVGGYVDVKVSNGGAWMPISKVPRPDGSWGPILHSVNQGKPGMIAVMRDGRRFSDESVSYHDLVENLIRRSDNDAPAGAFLLCDHRAFRKYGLGYAKPFLPLGKLIRSGYLRKAATLRELAVQIGIDPESLEKTVADYNRHAAMGKDPEFGKGESPYGRFLGDADAPVNPNIAPLDQAPYYAVWMYAGDIGNFAGIRTDENARVLRRDGAAVEGLFAVGNDMASVFRGRYPGGGALIGPAMTFGFIAARHMAGRAAS